MLPCFKIQEIGNRNIKFGSSNNRGFVNNSIKTTKYNLITFLPKSILLQFVRPANFVFLFTAVLQLIPFISAFSPIAAISPFIVVMLVSLIRQWYEDYKRYKNDTKTNESLTNRLVQSSFKNCQWKDVEIGDYLLIKNNQTIPADLVLLFTSQQNGVGFVETANLDGERNLKQKQAVILDKQHHQNLLQKLSGSITADIPNNNIHKFSGTLNIEGHEQSILSDQNLLLRGTILKNTKQIIGIAVYTGQDTKIMKNQGNVRHKVSHVEVRVNKIQIVLSIVLLAMCIYCSILYYTTWVPYGSRQNVFYLRTSDKFALGIQSVLMGLTAFLLLNFLVPISMNITLEILKTFQGDLLEYDINMRYARDQGFQYCGVYNASIIQQLGTVDFILSDKTGTLTANQMEFKFVMINNVQYSASQILQHISQYQKQKLFCTFWTSLLLCHDVIIDEQNSNFQGSSADQVCFLTFANSIDYKFTKRNNKLIEFQIHNKKYVFELLIVLPFDDRKMMSVVVRDTQNNEILIFTKGADNAVLGKRSKQIQVEELKSINNSLEKFSKNGWRTLVFGFRTIDQKQYTIYLKEYNKYIFQSTKKLKPQLELNQLKKSVYDLIQAQLQIIGVSAIQDKLQDGVPQTIKRLQEAGIKLVMITGDKLQTAENIGYLSNFIFENNRIYRITEHTQNIESVFNKIMGDILKQENFQFTIIIEGSKIGNVINEQTSDTLKMITQIILKCSSLIFCRSTPAQKGQIVKFFRENFNKIILAIGDGGNDVNMIQQAHIGVGILGKQGNQAACASDFYFSQFRFLDRLILHHGRWAYMRIAYFFVYYGFKNILMTMILFYYINYSGYSVQQFASDLYITCYNSLLSLVLTLYYGVWQQDINSDIEKDLRKKLPKIYQKFKQLDLFSYKRYIYWGAAAIFASLFMFFVTINSLSSVSSINQYGQTANYQSVIANISISLFLVITLVIMNDIYNYTWCTWICVTIFTFLIALIYYLLENFVDFKLTILSLTSTYMVYSDNTNWIFYLTIFFNTTVCYAVKVLIQTIYFADYPNIVEQELIRRETKKLPKVDTENQMMVLV